MNYDHLLSSALDNINGPSRMRAPWYLTGPPIAGDAVCLAEDYKILDPDNTLDLSFRAAYRLNRVNSELVRVMGWGFSCRPRRLKRLGITTVFKKEGRLISFMDFLAALNLVSPKSRTSFRDVSVTHAIPLLMETDSFCDIRTEDEFWRSGVLKTFAPPALSRSRPIFPWSFPGPPEHEFFAPPRVIKGLEKMHLTSSPHLVVKEGLPLVKYEIQLPRIFLERAPMEWPGLG